MTDLDLQTIVADHMLHPRFSDLVMNARYNIERAHDVGGAYFTEELARDLEIPESLAAALIAWHGVLKELEGRQALFAEQAERTTVQ